MAPLLFRDMKGLSCSSPASTAICPSLERQPMVRSHKAIVSASPLSQVPTEPSTHRHDGKKGQHHKAVAHGGGLVSPAGSSRYLLSGRAAAAAAAAEEIQEVESAPAVDASREEASQVADAKSTQAQEQVVVLKVSLHCKACAGKVKKHLSKMEGVTSFDIDFAAKKVTVVGDVTPLGVLNSVSKVKNAQLWVAPPAIAA
ncbi:protein SODIUM POTASSIUM ROOT DEFECTIVE 2-like [Phragmites australis]|uniref:protein SODIUM POTASSIUM ROOT DEFECTIVE 2-like n=1 Tax=Phragmites australis TaxID=29695 RepID=UPI002D77ABEE|nr:protein SODIUM POTASSIUM ROOT DEFECTIVE 2-like [Phragmites australis]